MAEFRFKERKNIITLTIEGKEYRFDCSPTNYGFVKRVAVLSREVQAASEQYNLSPKDTLFDIEKAFDLIKAKEEEAIEAILPGCWDELFKASGSDLMAMVDLIVYITGEIKAAGANAKRAEIAPEIPQDAETV